jgi:hypothetical protein
VRVIRHVCREGSAFTPNERLVALAIAAHMPHDGPDEAYPSRSCLVDWTGLSDTTVRQALKTITSGPHAFFFRVVGGARPGDRHTRYSSSRYELSPDIGERHAPPSKGSATRGARLTRGASGADEGSATRAEGSATRIQNSPLNSSTNREQQGERHAPPSIHEAIPARLDIVRANPQRKGEPTEDYLLRIDGLANGTTTPATRKKGEPRHPVVKGTHRVTVGRVIGGMVERMEQYDLTMDELLHQPREVRAEADGQVEDLKAKLRGATETLEQWTRQ